MTRPKINEELFKAISSPPEWATSLGKEGSPAYFPAKHVGVLEQFLSATTDSVRLVRASQASRSILEEFDMEELEELRAEVQASELMRVIPYGRQTDHSAHTLYLYLLGLYLFFACKPLRTKLATFLGEPDQSEKFVQKFLFQWMFVSLLHDVGYIFHGRPKNEIRAIDRMFRSSTITRLLDATDGLKQRVNKQILQQQIRPFETIQNPEDMLSLLRLIPWGKAVGLSDDGFETLSVYGPDNQQVTGSMLEDFAFQVASSGYDGFSEGVVDHAVASGLFLLRYSTFWFWLAKENNFEGPFANFKGNGFPKGYPAGDVVSACLATAAHNLIGPYGRKYGPLDIDSNPLMYLGVICDELQKWDRFPAGERHLIDLDSFEEHCTDSERIELNGAWDGDKVVVRFTEPKLADKVKEALKRLESVERFVLINPTTEELTAITVDGSNEETGQDGSEDARSS
jgi:hypothetical protein